MDVELFITEKICSKCGLQKSIDKFNFRNRAKGVRHSYCRDCGSVLTRNHYQQNKRQYFDKNSRDYLKRREFVRQTKSRPCFDCGVQYPYYVMDFDHRENEIKEFELNRIDRMTINALKREIAKCDVVCSNCHRERTHQRRKKNLLE